MLVKITDTVYDGIVNICKNSKGAIVFQITNDDRYYPIKLDFDNKIFKLENFFITKHIESLYPIGRAKINGYKPVNIKCMQCFNIRSAIRSTHNFKKVIHILRSYMKFCQPYISYDGYIGQ